MRPAAVGEAAVRARRLRPGHPRLRQRHCRRDEPGPGRRAAARHGREDGRLHRADQLRLRHAVDRHGLPLYPRRRLGPYSGRRRRSAEPRAAGVAATGRALVRRVGRRQGYRRQNHGCAEGEAELLQADHRARTWPDRSHHRTQHGPDRRGGRPSLRHHPCAVGRLCRRKPQAAGKSAIGRLAQGRGRDGLRPRRQVLRS